MQPAAPERPILFLDVDGVLLVAASVERSDGSWSYDIGFVPGAATMLARLTEAFEIHWATRWGDEANRQLAPELGLAELPVVNLDGEETRWSKLPAVGRVAGSRAAAWIDDELGLEELRWADDRRASTLLVQTDMSEGMTERDVEELLAFAASLQSG